MRKVYLAFVLALTLAGCATFNNPISNNQLAAIVSAYGIADSAAVAYRNRPLCKTGTIATFDNLCAQRSIIVKLQKADLIANKSIRAAVNWVVANPKLDASSVISVAQSALSAFQEVEATYGVH